MFSQETLWCRQSKGFCPHVVDQQTEALRAHTGSRDRPLGLGGRVEPFHKSRAPPRLSSRPAELRGREL